MLKKRIAQLPLSFFIVILILNITIFPAKSIKYIQESLNLCYSVVIPSLFPFMVLSKILINTTLFHAINKAFNGFARKIFGISGIYAGAFIMGCLAGFPTGTKNVADIYINHPDTKDEAERTLGFCNCASISFVVSVIGFTVFRSVKTGLIIYFLHVLSSVITGIIIRLINRKHMSLSHIKSAEQKKIPVSKNISEAISDSVNGILQICGIIICFSFASNAIINFADFFGSFLNDYNLNINFLSVVIKSLFEISGGIKEFAGVDASFSSKVLFCMVTISFSGFSIYMQIFNIVKNSDLSLKNYFTGKIIHVIISIALSFVFINLRKASVAVYYAEPYYLPGSDIDSYISLLITSVVISSVVFVLAILIILTIYLILKIKKRNFENE